MGWGQVMGRASMDHQGSGGVSRACNASWPKMLQAMRAGRVCPLHVAVRRADSWALERKHTHPAQLPSAGLLRARGLGCVRRELFTLVLRAPEPPLLLPWPTNNAGTQRPRLAVARSCPSLLPHQLHHALWAQGAKRRTLHHTPLPPRHS